MEKEIAELVDRRLAEETTCHLAVGLFDTARNQRVQVSVKCFIELTIGEMWRCKA